MLPMPLQVGSERITTLTRLLTIAVLAIAAVMVTAAPAPAATDTSQFSVGAGTLAFDTSPNVPDFGVLTLNGQAQTLTGQMSSWQAHDATGSGSGWNITVQGDSSAGKSAVFKEYCTDGTSTNGCNTAVTGGPGPGYVTSSPKTLSADSLTLSSTSASFTAIGGTTGTAPTHSCGTPCNVDHATTVKIASAASGAGMGTYQASGYTAASLALLTPSTAYAIGTGNKVYRVDLIFTLNSGP
jgi:hypothetical protein